MTDKEKLDRMKKLADGMYYAAKYLTTDASRLRKAMDEYQKFIIYEYNKQEPASEDLEKESDIMATKLFKEFFPQDGDMITPNDFCKGLRSFALHFADRQREQMMKDAIDAVVAEGSPMPFQESIPVLTNTDMTLLPKDKFSIGDKVKVIIIKE